MAPQKFPNSSVLLFYHPSWSSTRFLASIRLHGSSGIRMDGTPIPSSSEVTRASHSFLRVISFFLIFSPQCRGYRKWLSMLDSIRAQPRATAPHPLVDSPILGQDSTVTAVLQAIITFFIFPPSHTLRSSLPRA